MSEQGNAVYADQIRRASASIARLRRDVAKLRDALGQMPPLNLPERPDDEHPDDQERDQ